MAEIGQSRAQQIMQSRLCRADYEAATGEEEKWMEQGNTVVADYISTHELRLCIEAVEEEEHNGRSVDNMTVEGNNLPQQSAGKPRLQEIEQQLRLLFHPFQPPQPRFAVARSLPEAAP